MLVLAPSTQPFFRCVAAIRSRMATASSRLPLPGRSSRALATRARKYGIVLCFGDSFACFLQGVELLEQVGHAFLVVRIALGERPDDVGVGDIVGGPAEGVEGAVIALEAVLVRVLLAQAGTAASA